MIKSAALAACALSIAGSAHAGAAQDYVLNCMGCHGQDALGVPGRVPPLANTLTAYMRTPEGRAHLLRAPGAANSALSDSQLADVMNWLAATFNPGSGELPRFTAEEVSRYRHSR